MIKQAVILFAACSGATLFAEEKASIGVILPFSGDFARYGEQVRAGIEASPLKEYTLVYEDEGCDPKKAIDAYKKLSTVNHIRIFLGPWCGSPQMAVAPQLIRDNSIAIVGSAAPAAVYKNSEQRMLSSQSTVEEESIFNAKQISKAGYKKIVILFFENQFSRGHEAAFRSVFDGTVIETIAYTSSDSATVKGIALRVKKLAPDALYIPDAYPILHGLTKELARIGLQSIPKYSVFSAESEDTAKALLGNGDGLLYSYPDIGGRKALDVFPQKAAALLAEGLTHCGNQPICIRDYLTKKYVFNASGALEGGFVLKRYAAGTFSAVP